MSQEQILYFALPFAVLMLVTTGIFMLIEGKRMGKARFKAELMEEAQASVPFVPWYALLTPVVPLVPVLVFALLPRFYAKPAEITVASALKQSQGITVGIVPEDAYQQAVKRGRYTESDPLRKIAFDQPTRITEKGAYRTLFFFEDTPVLTATDKNFVVEPWSSTVLTLSLDEANQALAVTPTTTSTKYEFPIVVALLLGILYGAVTTWRRGTSTVQLLTKSSFDGVAAVGPALVLMLGIGMVLNATMAPQVNGIIQPLLKSVVPQGSSLGAMIWYVALFAVLAPLALYRGPLNLYGMGAGLIGALKGLMPPGAIMGAFLSVGMIQGVSDPTNTHNVWIANYTKTDVQDILKRTLPYMWVLGLLGLILSAALYYGGIVK